MIYHCEHCEAEMNEEIRYCSLECEDAAAFARAEVRADLLHDQMKEGDTQ